MRLVPRGPKSADANEGARELWWPVTLPAEVQPHVDAIRALLGVPACQLVLNIDKQGILQSVDTRVIYSRSEQPVLDRRATSRV